MPTPQMRTHRTGLSTCGGDRPAQPLRSGRSPALTSARWLPVRPCSHVLCTCALTGELSMRLWHLIVIKVSFKGGGGSVRPCSHVLCWCAQTGELNIRLGTLIKVSFRGGSGRGSGGRSAGPCLRSTAQHSFWDRSPGWLRLSRQQLPASESSRVGSGAQADELLLPPRAGCRRRSMGPGHQL